MTIYKGLKTIDKNGLPHPTWQFVSSAKEIKNLARIKDYVGWTIRTVKVNGPWVNHYANCVVKKDVPTTVDKLQVRHKNKALFVIYPSWKWKKGGTVLIEKNRVIIEARRGAIEDLMRYGNVEVSYIFQQGKLLHTAGDEKLLTHSELRKILKAQKKLSMKNVILEWGITTQGKFIFYRIEDIKEAARLLIKKYT
ncbi:hypothetical protein KKF61_04010 [Patescibacteria group bacterium]|nr:hypothetical protein [Patescibacteria group bacterium]